MRNEGRLRPQSRHSPFSRRRHRGSTRNDSDPKTAAHHFLAADAKTTAHQSNAAVIAVQRL
jgi:hypothetical protein